MKHLKESIMEGSVYKLAKTNKHLHFKDWINTSHEQRLKPAAQGLSALSAISIEVTSYISFGWDKNLLLTENTADSGTGSPADWAKTSTNQFCTKNRTRTSKVQKLFHLQMLPGKSPKPSQGFKRWQQHPGAPVEVTSLQHAVPYNMSHNTMTGANRSPTCAQTMSPTARAGRCLPERVKENSALVLESQEHKRLSQNNPVALGIRSPHTKA